MKKTLVYSMLTFLGSIGIVGITQCNSACNGNTQVYDLQVDWSTGQNPNGAWSYREGESLLVNSPLAWVGANYSGYQGVWPPSSPAIEKLTGFLPKIYAEAEAFQEPLRSGYPDWFFREGDVVLVPGVGGNILWTAPASGTINISGGGVARGELRSRYRTLLSRRGGRPCGVVEFEA